MARRARWVVTMNNARKALKIKELSVVKKGTLLYRIAKEHL